MSEVARDCEHSIEVDGDIESRLFGEDININIGRLVSVDRFEQERMRDFERDSEEDGEGKSSVYLSDRLMNYQEIH